MNKTIPLTNRVATITEYFLETNEDRPVIVICPGGAYYFRSDREAAPIARVFNEAGFHAVVVNYDLTPEELYDEPLKDVAAAITYLRTNATTLHIIPDKILVCGFSAGGHLAASIGVFWNDSTRFPERSVRELQKPNGLILCYPVISGGKYAHQETFGRLSKDKNIQMEYSLEKKVNDQVPPCFMWHTMTDGSVPVQNTMLFSAALLEHHVSCEVLLYPRGGHGLSLATKEVEEENSPNCVDPHIAGWVNQCVDWINNVILCN